VRYVLPALALFWLGAIFWTTLGDQRGADIRIEPSATTPLLWTMLGVPAVTVPVASGPNGMPIGVQLIGAWDRDRELLAIAHRIDERVRAGRSPSGP